MDVRYINPFVKSIANTFQTMCSVTINVGNPELKHGDDPSSDVTSVIGFSGDAAGSVALLFNYEVASKIASNFAGTEINQDHEDFADAIGELANMVAGGAKAQFEGLNISISLPNVILGKNHNISGSKNAPRLIIPCKTDMGTFYMEIGMVLSIHVAATKTAAVGASQ